MEDSLIFPLGGV